VVSSAEGQAGGDGVQVGGVVKPNTYRDSVALMLLSTRLAELPGVRQASAMMGTPANREILAATGLLADALQDARPNDLCLAVEATDEDALQRTLEEAERLLAAGPGAPAEGGGAVGVHVRPRTLESALRLRPEANLALISVPGEYAAFEARRALRRGLHVFLFSDNVPLEDEVALKRLAQQLGLLVMGPDCGTALIGGAPLGFANAVRRGSIGIVASSGTGLQEVSCLIDRLGEGISHALGTGSRDLSAQVGGITFLAALNALAEDDSTRVLALIAKPGAPEVEARVWERLSSADKPAVAYFLSRSGVERLGERVVVAADLEHAARCAVALARGERPPTAGTTRVAAEQMAQKVVADLAPGQRVVSGLFAGGTLAQEAALAIQRALGAAAGGPPREAQAGEVLNASGHRIVDLGDDAFTRGRPHPLIDWRLRNEQLVEQAGRGNVALFLLDVVLGYGTHPNPAEALRPGLERAREATARAGARLHVLASICGTDADPQGYQRQRQALEDLGIVVAESSSAAALVAGRVAGLLSQG